MHSFVLFPKDLSQSHYQVMKLIKTKKNKKLEEKYKILVNEYKSMFEMQSNGLMIIVPNELTDIIIEGKKLHHCVVNYVERVANKDTVILFIRNKNQPFKPYYTMEVENGNVVQVRGQNNKIADNAVNKLVDKFKVELKNRLKSKEHNKLVDVI